MIKEFLKGLLTRRSASAPVQKGSIAPFDRLLGEVTTGAGGSVKLREPYLRSTWVQAAIKLVTQPVTDVPLKFSNDARTGKQIVTDPALAQFWESPALRGDKQPLSMGETIEASLGWIKLAGDVFWILDDTIFAAPSALPFPEEGISARRFLVARPDRMEAQIAKGDGSLIGWKFTDGAGRHHLLAVQQVIQISNWNPYIASRGASEYCAAENAARSEYAAGQFKLNLWSANGDRGQYVILKNGAMLDDLQRKQMEAELRDKQEKARRGIYTLTFLGGDITVEDPKAQTVDAAFVSSRPEDRHEIFIAFGVPPSMADVTASYSIGSASDWYRLIRGTCMPAGRKISDAIETVLRRTGAPARYAWFDWRRHPVMQQVLREQIEPAVKMWATGMSWAKINEWLELDLPEFDGWDEGYLPFSVTPVSMAGEMPDEGDPDGGGSRAGIPPGGGSATAAAAGEAVERMFKALQGDVVKARSGRELAQARAHTAKRLAASRAFIGPFRRELLKARAEVLAKIDAQQKGTGVVIEKAGAFDFMFNAEAFRNQLFASFRNPWKQTLHTAGQELFSELRRDDPFTMPEPLVERFLAARKKNIEDMSEGIYSRVKASLQEGIDKGEAMSELATRVRAEFNGIEKGRSEVIAMTETGAAYGEARHEGMKIAGVTHKQWLTSGLANVRPAHAAANGQTVKVDEPFLVGGEALDHPGDDKGSPGNVINCHCVEIAVADPDQT